MKHDRTVIGYHGTVGALAEGILRGAPFAASANEYDWLGRGIYFWEYGPARALRWAERTIKLRYEGRRGGRPKPAVVGAVIQLGRCFDLMDTRFTHALEGTHATMAQAAADIGRELPKNGGPAPDLKMRALDCAVLNLHLDVAAELDPDGAYDTVRGTFTEGGPAFPGSMILRQTHTQISVRNPACIVGVFRPTMEPR